MTVSASRALQPSLGDSHRSLSPLAFSIFSPPLPSPPLLPLPFLPPSPRASQTPTTHRSPHRAPPPPRPTPASSVRSCCSVQRRGHPPTPRRPAPACFPDRPHRIAGTPRLPPPASIDWRCRSGGRVPGEPKINQVPGFLRCSVGVQGGVGVTVKARRTGC